MGGGVSVSSNYGEKLTIHDIKEICGGVLNENLYDCVKDENNLVEKDKFLKILTDSMEQEILFLYFHFTKSKMNYESFLYFCSHAKLLTKNSFRRFDAEELFHQVAAASNKTNPTSASANPSVIAAGSSGGPRRGSRSNPVPSTNNIATDGNVSNTPAVTTTSGGGGTGSRRGSRSNPISSANGNGATDASSSSPTHGAPNNKGPCINYIQLRFEIFPQIAMKKGIDLQALLVKLSRLPPPNFKERPSSQPANGHHPLTISHSVSGAGAGSEDGRPHSPNTTDRIDKNIAATKIQKIQRTWLAKNELAKEKELHSILSGKHTTSGTQHPHTIEPTDTHHSSHEWHHHNQSFAENEEEIKCQLFYSKYCNEKNEMDIKDFLRLCYDSELIPFESHQIDFTGKDAQFIFKKIIAKYFNPEENCYHPGVVHGKRVVYDVFRLRLIPEIAAIKRVGIQDIVRHIAYATPGGRRHEGRNGSHHSHKGGPQIVSLLDQRHIDERLKHNTEHYGEHVE